MKETGTTHWVHPNDGATNKTGFTSLPGGYRDPGGTFNDLGSTGFWWTTSFEQFYISGYFHDLSCNSSFLFGRVYNGYNFGYSVRCLKD